MKPFPASSTRPALERARRSAGRVLAALALSAAVVAACSGDSSDTENSGPAALFPADYAATYSEVRNCRSSTEHDFSRVRVLADPNALGPYRDRNADFPVGAVVLKEQYDFGDTDCTGAILRWTVMERLPTGSSPETLDWRWQDVEPSRAVKTENEARCIGCHTTCGVAPDGYQGTCTVVGAIGEAFR